MEPFLGQISLFAFSRFVPEGWMPCDGRTVPVSQYQALFSLLGFAHGGDGQTQFGLPKLEAPVKGTQYCIAVVGGYPTPAN